MIQINKSLKWIIIRQTPLLHHPNQDTKRNEAPPKALPSPHLITPAPFPQETTGSTLLQSFSCLLL